MNNKRGEMTFIGIIIAIVIIFLTFPITEYISLQKRVDRTERDIAIALSQESTAFSANMYDIYKNPSNTAMQDALKEKYKERDILVTVLNAAGFEDTGENKYTNSSGCIIDIDTCKLNYTFDNEYKITLKYTISCSFTILGARVSVMDFEKCATAEIMKK